MLKNLLSFFQEEVQGPRYSPEQSTQMAAAALMVEVMFADHKVDSEEEEKIKQLISNTLEIDSEPVEKIIEIAKQEVEEAVSLYQFTSLVNEHMDRERKLDLVLNLWQVAYADGEIDKYEEHIIRKVCELIYVGHSDFIKAKHKAKSNSEK